MDTRVEILNDTFNEAFNFGDDLGLNYIQVVTPVLNQIAQSSGDYEGELERLAQLTAIYTFACGLTEQLQAKYLDLAEPYIQNLVRN